MSNPSIDDWKRISQRLAAALKAIKAMDDWESDDEYEAAMKERQNALDDYEVFR